MVKNLLYISLTSMLVTGLLGDAHAEQWIHYGTRSMGMGGVGVAVTEDATASYWNPGALALVENWDIQIPVGLVVGIQGDAISQADDIAEAFELLDQATLDAASGNSTDIQNAINLVEELSQLDEGDGLFANFHAGGQFRIHTGLGGFAGGVNDFTYAGANAFINFADFISLADGGFGDLFSATGTGNTPGTADGQAFSQSMQNEGITKANADELAFQAEQAGADLSDPDVVDALLEVAKATNQAGANNNTIDANETGIEIAGLEVLEFNLAYAYPLFENKLGIGANLKVMQGTSFSNLLTASDLEDGKDIENDILDKNNKKTTTEFGLDLGALYQPFSRLKVGITARNINAPSFDVDGRDVDEITLDPQVRAGVAFLISDNSFVKWQVAADLDVLKNESDVLDNHEVQEIGIGTEANFNFTIIGLALRGGAFQNFAISGSDPVLTGGLGLRIWRLQIDLAAQYATGTEDIGDGDDIPTQLGLGGQVQFSWNF